MTDQKNPQLGILLAVSAQVIWGSFPVYLHFINDVPAMDIVVHRTVWSFVLLLGLLLFSSVVSHPMLPTFKEAAHTFRTPKVLGACCLAAIFIASNWVTFVWSANNDHKVDASLGYYICPQVLVLLGVLFLGERLRWAQWLAVAIVGGGVVLTSQSDATAIWIPLVIAFSFGFYAFCKKKTTMSALGGLTFETGILSIPAILIFVVPAIWSQTFFTGILWKDAMLFGMGATTIAPLALYAAALKHIQLSTMGFLQFIGPTIQFLLGVLVFNEPYDWTRMVGFAIVWVGVTLFLVYRKPKSVEVDEPATDAS
ncbi:MAG: EamA family transporter RarD [Planctomycetota bacterium]